MTKEQTGNSTLDEIKAGEEPPIGRGFYARTSYNKPFRPGPNKGSSTILEKMKKETTTIEPVDLRRSSHDPFQKAEGTPKDEKKSASNSPCKAATLETDLMCRGENLHDLELNPTRWLRGGWVLQPKGTASKKFDTLRKYPKNNASP